MKEGGLHNLAILVASGAAGIFSFYGFLAYRARLWSPRWAISPTQKTNPPSVSSRASPKEDSPIHRGRSLYRQAHCGVCHGPGGEGGVKNPNADNGGSIPGFIDLAQVLGWEDFRDRLKEEIKKGAQTGKMDKAKPGPPLNMPPWKNEFSDSQLEDLLRYLYSLKG